MIRIVISGCNGKMGQVVARMCGEREGISVAAGIDANNVKLSDYPVYSDPMEYAGAADVLIDFSNPSLLDKLLGYCERRKLPAVLCTTGYSPEQLERIFLSSESIPIFKSGNMSLGINLLTHLLRTAAQVLGESYDVEIVERHHKMKIDSPSGTALMLADAVSEGLSYTPEYVYERRSVRAPRGKKEIGISAVRGGTVVGEHEVSFFGPDEVIEFKHAAHSREVFANGAVSAAIFMSGIKAPGMYDMNDVLRDII